MSIRDVLQEEAERLDQAKANGEFTIDVVRDLMCHEQPTLSPEEAAFVLSNRFPGYPYEALLRSTRLVHMVKELASKSREKV
jgi:hypothetical protein